MAKLVRGLLAVTIASAMVIFLSLRPALAANCSNTVSSQGSCSCSDPSTPKSGSTVNGNLQIPNGVTCTLTNVTITGDVTVGQGATLNGGGGGDNFEHDIDASGSSTVTLTNDTVDHDVNLNNDTTVSVMGSCIEHDGGFNGDGTVTINNNEFEHDLNCNGNGTINSPHVNVVDHNENGQCTGFPTSAGGSSGPSNSLPVNLFVGYADNAHLPPEHDGLPTGFQGGTGVFFVGAPTSGTVPGTGGFDAGAIRFDNITGQPVTISNVSVDIGPNFHYALWSSFTIPAHDTEILTQTGSFNFDTSETPEGNCKQDALIPVVNFSIGCSTYHFHDTAQIINTGGIDGYECNYQTEFHDWSQVTN